MFLLIFEQLLKMFFILLLAFICYKIRLVDQNGNKTVSNLLLLVVNPILIITVYQTDYDAELVRGLLLAFAAAAATHALGIIISTVLIRPGSGPDFSIERFNAIYSNCGFIGIPLIGSVLGDTGVFYLTAYMVMFNLFSWTHGVTLMEKKFTPKNLKEVFPVQKLRQLVCLRLMAGRRVKIGVLQRDRRAGRDRQDHIQIRHADFLLSGRIGQEDDADHPALVPQAHAGLDLQILQVLLFRLPHGRWPPTPRGS